LTKVYDFSSLSLAELFVNTHATTLSNVNYYDSTMFAFSVFFLVKIFVNLTLSNPQMGM